MARHVGRRAGDDAVVLAITAITDPPRQTEVADLRLAALVDQHVARLQVEVQDPDLVRVLHRLGDRPHHPRDLQLRTLRVRADPLPQCRPTDKTHREVVEVLEIADFKHRDDVWMGQSPGMTCLGSKARNQLVGRERIERQQLQRDFAVETQLPRAIHDAHAAGADLLQQQVVVDAVVGRVVEIEFGRAAQPRPLADLLGRLVVLVLAHGLRWRHSDAEPPPDGPANA